MSGKTVLIADDDSAIRTVLSQALSRAGYSVRSTATAGALWRWVTEGQGDAMVTDVVLPDENAFDVIPRIKKLRPTLPIQHRVDLRSRQLPFADGNDPVVVPAGEDGGDLLAASHSDGRAAQEGEGHVRPESGSHVRQGFAPEAEPPERVTGNEGGSSVCAAPGHSARQGNALAEIQPDRRRAAGVRGDHLDRAYGKVAMIEREDTRTLPLDSQRDTFARLGGGDLVVETHGVKDSGDVVEAVLAESADGQLEVDLGGHSHPD